jgi:hypothetical protein
MSNITKKILYLIAEKRAQELNFGIKEFRKSLTIDTLTISN